MVTRIDLTEKVLVWVIDGPEAGYNERDALK